MLADHPRDRQEGARLDAGDVAAAEEHDLDVAGAVGERDLQGGHAGPGLDPDRRTRPATVTRSRWWSWPIGTASAGSGEPAGMTGGASSGRCGRRVGSVAGGARRPPPRW